MQDTIYALDREISGQIDKLEQTVRDLLQIEFAWVSINEAHRSTSLATSMKRLSWITVGQSWLGCAMLTGAVYFPPTYFCLELIRHERGYPQGRSVLALVPAVRGGATLADGGCVGVIQVYQHGAMG
ncbi:uncharacterized protein BO80DRAFT_260808 [Aspergillus ibericus CBS 121593]|uniref:Uncharacterized protein n=1 Tax=Aspergillus ibericus CBS 121593 TaxID=1448316 RepID=A0A395GKG1_9EURO|nr:hypothetical protein BO80DRAFT_260808 [Aspergillus ibericus CBS 121593]RAK95528.1 hypothetical protein BO80DRAFT_260808 [Aspergillus ibericus CBS 121593]